jgi:hypothetical protein
MTYRQARELIKSMGCTLHVQDGEYRVNLYKGTEETAYYTDDLQDAVNTAARMTEQYED